VATVDPNPLAVPGDFSPKDQLTMTSLASAIESELQLAGLPFDQADLIAFVDCNHMLIDDAPNPAV
jgi:hypothetical protein